MKTPRPISKLIEAFESLPGIGPKTAQRLTFHLLNFPAAEVKRLSEALMELKENVKLCSVCKNVSEDDLCNVCNDPGRNQNILAVVSGPLDVFAIERTGYKGLYHVLHGVIDPLNNVGPEELFLTELKSRIRNLVTGLNQVDDVSKIEVILATNTSMEGETTAMYINRLIKDSDEVAERVKITRIARGLPVGGDIEYADDVTLSRALDGRLDF